MKKEKLTEEQMNQVNNGVEVTPTESTSNGIAIAGFILSFLFALLGLILSIVGLQKSKETNSGRGLAIAGIIIAVLNMIAGVILQYAAPSLLEKISETAGEDKCKYATKCEEKDNGKYSCEYTEDGKKYTITCDENPLLEINDDTINLDEE